MNQSAICAGTFDPLTMGHLDVIERASRIFPRVVIAVATNPGKDPLFSLEQRIELVKNSTAHLEGIEVDSFDGLLVDFAESKDVRVIVRGLRAFSDFEYEFRMALANHRLDSEIEVIALITSEDHTFLSSSTVKEIACLGGDVSSMVPDYVFQALRNKVLKMSEDSQQNSGYGVRD